MATVDYSPPDTGYDNPYMDSLIWGAKWVGTVTYTFGDTAGQSWTLAEQQAFRNAFAQFEAVTNLTFEYQQSYAVNLAEYEKTSETWNDKPGIITLADHNMPGVNQGENGSDTEGRYNTNHPSWSDLSVGGMGFSTIVHELGHAMGLEHPHDGDQLFPGVERGNAFNDLGDNNLNQAIWTIMSYNRGWTGVPTNSNSWGHAGGLMAFDIAALQLLYGTNWTTNAGDNVYVLPTINQSGTFWTCIWDGGGDDTISNAGSSIAATIDLRAAPLTGANAGGYVSWNAAIMGGFTIANKVVIENAIGGSGNDTITGNAAKNMIEGGAGADTINGQGGIDTVSYEHSSAGVDVDLSRSNPAQGIFRAPSGGDAQGDTIVLVENIRGSAFADRLVGINAGSVIEGLKGDDTIFAGNGNDTVRGGLGADTIGDSGGNDTIYGGDGNLVVNGGFEVSGDVTVKTDGYVDSVSSLDGWTLLSGAGMERFSTGVAGGPEPSEGRFGLDMEQYAPNTNVAITQQLQGAEDGVRYRLAFDASKVSGADARLEVYFGGQKLNWNGTDGVVSYIDPATNFGTYYIDVFGGTGAGADKNRLTFVEIGGGDANGTLLDNVRFYKVAEGVDKAGDYDPSADGNDVFNLGTGSDTVYGDGGDDTANFSDTAGGNDHFNGGSGTDLLVMNWSGATGAIFYSGLAMSDSTAFGMAESYTISLSGQHMYFKEAERFNLTGGSGNDSFKGGRLDDILIGNGGDDTLNGGGGTDVLNGGEGFDRAVIVLGGGGNTINLAQAAGGGSITLANGTQLISIESISLEAGDGSDFLDVRGTVTNVPGTPSTSASFNRTSTFFDGKGGQDTLAVDLATSWDAHFDGGVGVDRLIMDWRDASSGIFRDTDGSYKSYSHTVTVVNHGSTDYFYTASFTSVERFDLTGGLGNDFLYGGDRDDRLNGWKGRDTLAFGAGNDTLVLDWSGYGYGVNDSGVTGGSLASGYDGNFNTYYSDTYAVSFTGAENFDLTLTDNGDAITVGDGNDIVRGNGGNDTLRTGKGIDTIDGGAGDDRWTADKSFLTSTQSMTLNLQLAGTQTTYQGATVKGIEMLSLQTGAGNDTLITLKAFFTDELTTNGGNDWVKVQGGRDSAAMGAGTDTLVVDWSGYGYGVNDSGVTGGTFAGGYDGNFNTYYSDTNAVSFSGVEHFDMTLTDNGDSVTLGDGNDKVYGLGGGDTLRTGMGIDIVNGGAGDDRWVADKSFMTTGQAMVLDLRLAGTQATYLTGGIVSGIEMVTLSTGAGNDTISTLRAFFTDDITTGAGNDQVTVGGGRDTAHMGGGTDTLFVDWRGYGYGVNDSGITAGTLAGGYSGDFNTYYSDTNAVTFSGVEHFDLLLTDNGDAITVGDGNDRVLSFGGDDTIRTGKGIDIVDGGTGNDRWVADKSASATNDPMLLDLDSTGVQASYMGTGSVTGIEMVTLSTGAGADVIKTRGEFFNDSVTTNGGNDRVSFGGGRDTATMGAGNDTLAIDWTGYGYGVNDSGIQSGSVAAGYAGNFNTYYGDTNSVDFAGVENFDLTLTAQGDAITVGDGNDKVLGRGGDDTLRTGKGTDIVDGGDGNDRWVADKSFLTSTQVFRLDLTAAAVQAAYLGTGSIAGIEMVTLTTGGGGDQIVTRRDFFNDEVNTGSGNDKVTVGGGRDIVNMGSGNDILILDWSGYGYGVNASGVTGASAGSGHDGNFNTYYGETNRVDFTGVEIFRLTLTDNADNVTTGNGADIINGMGGADYMAGGGGNDTYYVDQMGDQVRESVNGGRDTVYASASYQLEAGQSVEALRAADPLGTVAMDLTGNEFGNAITGNDGNNVIDGRGGLDTMTGSGGDDTYMVDYGRDVVVEKAGGGTDTVLTSVNYTLATGVQVEIFKAADAAALTALKLTGNTYVNAITGNAGANTLDGGGAADRLEGLGGNDIYIVDRSTDVVVEAVDGGRDTVRASASYALAADAQIEVLETTSAAGTTTMNLTGSSIANTITGNAGANIITGGGGSDVLTGGAGLDSFVFNSALGADNIDRITDLEADTDRIRLENSGVFDALVTTGTLGGGFFRLGAVAVDGDDHILFDSATGSLFYDADGVGGVDAVKFATLTIMSGTLGAADFLVV